MRKITFELAKETEVFEFPNTCTDEDITDEFNAWLDEKTFDVSWRDATEEEIKKYGITSTYKEV